MTPIDVRQPDGEAIEPSTVVPAPLWIPPAVLPFAVFLLLATAVFAVYGASINAPFIFDDVQCIVNNPSIMQLWPPLGTIEAPGPLRPPQDFNTAGRPLVNLSLALNVATGGVNPFGFHLVNMLLHTLSATLLWGIVRRTLCLPFFSGRFDRVAFPLAFLVALLWALHPLQTEAVQYVSQRTELMMGWCYLAVMYASLRYITATVSGQRNLWLALATMASLAGMACKEVMVSAPAMVLLYDRTFLSGSFLRAVRKSWPLYVGLLLGWGLLLALNLGGPRSASAGFHLEVPAYAWWMMQSKVLWLYLKLTVWPWPLVIHYEFPYLETLAVAWPWVLGVAGLVVATILLVWRRTAAGFLSVWMFAILSPTLVVPIVTEIAVERRMYLPLIAPIVLFVVGGYALLDLGARKIAHQANALKRWPIAGTAAAALTIAAIFSALDVRRLAAYDDALTLWGDAFSHQPDNYFVQVNLGVELLNSGHPEEAIPHLEDALKLNQIDAYKVHADLGSALLRAKRPAEARKHLEEALRLKPEFAEAQGNYGHLLLHHGSLTEAIPRLQEALRLRPDVLAVRQDLGIAMINSGRSAEAVELLEPVVRLKPDSAEAHRDLGLALGNLGRLPEAIEQFEAALRLKLDTAQLHQFLGVALLNTGHTQSGIEHFERALELEPNSADSHHYLGIAHFNAGRMQQSIAEFELALSMQPDHPAAKEALQRAKQTASPQ